MSQLDIGAAETVTLDGVGAPVAALHTGAEGPAVLLVPGYTGSKEDFGPLLDPIAAAGFRAYAIDLPGQYESPGPPDPARYSVDELGAVLLALAAGVRADAADRRVHLVGHSFGGLVSRAAVLAAQGPAGVGPTAGRGPFASLVLMGSGPAALDGGRRERMQLLRPVLASHGLTGVYAAMQAAESAAPDYVAPPAPLAALYERRFVTGSPAMLEGMGDALLAEPDRVDELAAVGLAILVLYGVDDDAWPPPVQDEMARRLRVRPTVIPDAAHSPAVENPAATASALIDFWRSVGA